MFAHHPLRHWLLLAALSLCIGSTFIMTKIALHSLSPASVVFGRLALGALFFLPAGFIERRKFAQMRHHWAHILLLGFTWMAFPFLISTWGQQGLPSATSGVLMAFMPLVVIILAHFYLPGEGLTRWKAGGFAIGFLGTCVLIGPSATEAFSGDATLLVHKLAVLGSAVSYAVCVVVARKLPPFPRVPLSVATLAASTVMVAPFALPGAFEDFATVTPGSLLALLGLTIFPTMIGFFLNMRLISEAGASFASYNNYLIPMWATFLGAVLAHESLSINTYIALPIILAGIAVSQRRRKTAGRDESQPVIAARPEEL